MKINNFFLAERAKLLYYTLAFYLHVLLLNGWIDPHEILLGHSNHLWEGINLKWAKSNIRLLPYGPLKFQCYSYGRNVLFGLAYVMCVSVLIIQLL